MESKKEGLLMSKIRAIISYLYHLVSLFIKLSSPIQNLISSTVQYRNRKDRHMRSSASPSPLSPPSSLPLPSTSSSSSSTSLFLNELNHSSTSLSWSSSTMGDLIGTESGVYTSTDEDMLLSQNTKPYNYKKRVQKLSTSGKEYPPPIPLLVRTGNLSCRMPWVLTREYVDGRLILRKTKVNRYEYFEIERKNGRLALNLVVPSNDAIQCFYTNSKENERENTNEAELEVDDDSNNGDKLKNTTMDLLVESGSFSTTSLHAITHDIA